MKIKILNVHLKCFRSLPDLICSKTHTHTKTLIMHILFTVCPFLHILGWTISKFTSHLFPYNTRVFGHFPLQKKKKKKYFSHFTTLHILCLKSLPISHHNPNHFSCPADSLPILQNSQNHCRPQRTSLLATHYICIYSSINAKLLSPYYIYTQMDLISPSWSLTWLLFNISAWAFLLPK